jgi:hypothetical protein
VPTRRNGERLPETRPVTRSRVTGRPVSAFRGWTTLLSSTALLPWSLLFACDTGAVRVEDCRTIEYARCDAAEQCDSIDDSAQCRLFYRDHCLHGLPLNSDVIIRSEVRDCAEAIESAGDCAEAEGADAPLSQCGSQASDAAEAPSGSACDLVNRPELFVDSCQFLLAHPPDAGAPR